MKKTKRGLMFVLLAVAGGMALLGGNAQGADDAMPPEVKALIGMRIPAKAGNVVPGWMVMGAGMLGVKTETGKKLGYELLYQQDISVFVIDAMDIDHNRTILDARVLPLELLNYNIKDSKIVFKKNSSQFYAFEHGCKKSDPYDEKVLAGLVRPEPGKEECGHWSSQVNRAWSIDPETGRISDIPKHGVSCLIQSESICQ